ncbi:MAG: hypothetical protein PHR28_11840 [candidate division Zixibacteria bacterium]|nr:hypothetical protein [candidate division Zixibacteria bacterium]
MSMNNRLLMPIVVLAALLTGCGRETVSPDAIAERYVKLALNVNQYKTDYLDAYFGPPEWQPQRSDSSAVFPYPELHAEATALLTAVDTAPTADTIQQIRLGNLRRQLRSLDAMIEILHGKKMSFDEESQALYGVVAPSPGKACYDSILNRLDTLLPGVGDVAARMTDFRSRFIILADKIDTLVKIALTECRRKTAEHIPLPPGDTFVIEYVGGKPWGGYNWYQGNFHGLMQIDTSRPLYVTSLFGLVAHEGYPGHHLANVLREKELLRDRHWMEYSVVPLYHPGALVDEGSANYAAGLIFSPEEQAEFVATVLCPTAGINPAEVKRYFDIQALRKRLDYAWIDAARAYLDGSATKDETIAWLTHYCLRTPQEAASSIAFFETFRSYAITYAAGEDLVKAYVEGSGETVVDPATCWDRFRRLLLDSSPLWDTAK